jgi:hypothetical protein
MEHKSNPEMARQSFIKGTDYFSKWIKFKQEVSIPKRIAQTKTPGPDAKNSAQFVFKIFIERYELLIEKYSRGDDLNELRTMLPEIVEAWEWARREELKVFNEAEMARRHGFAVNFDAHNLALWMVSIALCLEADDELFKRMLALIGNESVDKLFEKLVGTRVSGRKPADNWLYASSYDALIAVVADPQSPHSPARLKQFLDNWYPAMKKTYWHDCHLGKDGGGYFGYWCFEAASVVKAFKLDDSLIRENPYYPKDMAAFTCM